MKSIFLPDEGGYLYQTDPNPAGTARQNAVLEFSTTSCGHCNALVRTQRGDFAKLERCQTCWRPVCTGCRKDLANGLSCDVIERKLQRWEAK